MTTEYTDWDEFLKVAEDGAKFTLYREIEGREIVWPCRWTIASLGAFVVEDPAWPGLYTADQMKNAAPLVRTVRITSE